MRYMVPYVKMDGHLVPDVQYIIFVLIVLYLICFLQAEKMVLAVGDCVQFREEVQSTLDDLIQGQKEAQAEVTKILDCPTVREAQQLLLVHQVLEDINNQLFNIEFKLLIPGFW